VLVPRWALADAAGMRASRDDARRDFAAALRRTLADPDAAARVRTDVAHEISRRGGADRTVVFDHPDPSFGGASLAELAARHARPPVEMALKLPLAGDASRPGGARVRVFSLAGYDSERYAALPWVATAPDGGIALPEDG